MKTAGPRSVSHNKTLFKAGHSYVSRVGKLYPAPKS